MKNFVSISLLSLSMLGATPWAHAQESDTERSVDGLFDDARWLPAPNAESIRQYGDRLVRRADEMLRNAQREILEGGKSSSAADE